MLIIAHAQPDAQQRGQTHVVQTTSNIAREVAIFALELTPHFRANLRVIRIAKRAR
jgi:hypothetical protein